MERSTLPTVKAGDHWSLRMSRQMAPLLLMLQWYMRVRKTTCAVPSGSLLAVPLPHWLKRLVLGRWIQAGNMYKSGAAAQAFAERLAWLALTLESCCNWLSRVTLGGLNG